MKMFQVRTTVGTDHLKFRRVHEKLIAGGNVNFVAIEGDTSQPAVPTSSLPIDVAGVPVYGQGGLSLINIDQIYAAMTLALVASPYNRTRNKNRHGVGLKVPFTE
jgi:hypothetical protein